MKAKYIFTIVICGVRFGSDLIEGDLADKLRWLFGAFKIPWSELQVGE